MPAENCCDLPISYCSHNLDQSKTGQSHRFAASIEMLHTATLIHDDIVDEAADLRRGQPNIRSQFGNVVSVYAGDYLFVCCFKLLV